MSIIKVIEFLISFLFIFFMIGQIIIPLWNERKICPIFRKDKNRLEDELISLNELEDTYQLIKEIEKRKQKLSHTGKINGTNIKE